MFMVHANAINSSWMYWLKATQLLLTQVAMLLQLAAALRAGKIYYIVSARKCDIITAYNTADYQIANWFSKKAN